MSSALGHRYQEYENDDDFHQSLELQEQAIGLDGPKSVYYANKGNILVSRYRVTKTPQNLAIAVEYLQGALDSAQLDYVDRMRALWDLGKLLWERYTWTNNLADLESVIEVKVKFEEETWSHDPKKTTACNELGELYGQKYYLTQQREALAKAIYYRQEFLRQLGDTPFNNAEALNVLTNQYIAKYRDNGQDQFVQRASTTAEQALGELSRGENGLLQNNAELGRLMAEIFRQSGGMDITVLRSAIKFGERFLRLLQAEGPLRIRYTDEHETWKEWRSQCQ